MLTLPIIPGKDCSEYSEELQNILGDKVEIRTIRAINSRGNNELFRIVSNIDTGPYYYHTITTFTSKKEKFVADIFHPLKTIPVRDYILQLKQYNQTENVKFIWYKGCFDTFDLPVRTLEKLKGMGINYSVI